MKIRNRLLVITFGWMIYFTLRLIFWTVRKRYAIADPDTLAYQPDTKGRYLYCTWHDSILLPLFLGRPRHMAAIVSQHRDGGYLTDLMRKLRIHCVRGSSTSGGVEALREAIKVAQERHITITPDGPQGPRRELKDGIVFLASKARRPIVATGFYCERCWRIQGRWTDLVVPRPFSKVYLVLSQPIHIPQRISRDELSLFTQVVQETMETTYAQAEQLATSRQTATTEETADIPAGRTTDSAEHRRAA